MFSCVRKYSGLLGVCLYYSCVTHLLRNHAKTALRDEKGFSPLHYAALSGNRNAIRIVCTSSLCVHVPYYSVTTCNYIVIQLIIIYKYYIDNYKYYVITNLITLII